MKATASRLSFECLISEVTSYVLLSNPTSLRTMTCYNVGHRGPHRDLLAPCPSQSRCRRGMRGSSGSLVKLMGP